MEMPERVINQDEHGAYIVCNVFDRNGERVEHPFERFETLDHMERAVLLDPWTPADYRKFLQDELKRLRAN